MTKADEDKIKSLLKWIIEDADNTLDCWRCGSDEEYFLWELKKKVALIHRLILI